MASKGLDLSTYNLVKDYEKAAKDDVDFVILRIMVKSQNYDSKFLTHWNGFTKAGVTVQGVYNYSYAQTVAQFISDAQAVIRLLDGRKVMVWLDIEDKTLANLGQTLIDGIFAYKNEIEKAGLKFGIYTYISFYNSYMKKWESTLQGIPFWIARYPSTQKIDNSADPNQAYRPQLNQKVYGWQYASTGYVDGIEGNVDLNYWYVDLEVMDDIEHKKTVDQIVQEIMEGKWGTGDDRKKRLESAGYNYRIIQDAVNAYVKAAGESQEAPAETPAETPVEPPVKEPEVVAEIVMPNMDLNQIVKDIVSGKFGNGDTRKTKVEAAGYDYTIVQTAVNEYVRNKATVEAKNIVDQIVSEVLAGKYGNGEDRKKRLEAEGYDYAVIQAAVNTAAKKR